MNKIFPLLLFSLYVPLASNAESVWLLLHAGHDDSSMEKIKMKDMNQCELMGAKWKAANFSKHPNPTAALHYHSYICLEGE